MSSSRQPSQSRPGRPQLGSGSGATAVGGGASIDDIIGADLVHNILSRLPAISFACAACVNRSWNSSCARVLSVPKLSSAFSQNPTVEGAVNEVLEKVLSEPIRPDFVIASTSEGLDRYKVHDLLTKRFGSSTPVVTCLDFGIIARDSLTNEAKEIQWEEDVENDHEDDYYRFLRFNNDDSLPKGLVLTVGYLPGLKSTLIPLPSADKVTAVDKFVNDIRTYASDAPHNSPSAIILFSNLVTNMSPILQKLDYAFPRDTVIVGQDGRCLSYQSNWDKNKSKQQSAAVVALVFAKDREKPSGGIEGIQFHATLSTGLWPVGPIHRARSVKYHKNKRNTWLTARVGTAPEDLDGQTMLDNVYNEIGDGYQNFCFYIGVEKWRNCSVGTDRPRAMTFLEFHEVFGGNEEYLFVNEGGIRTGDHFRFYITDPKAALDSRDRVYDFFKCLKPNYMDASTSNQLPVGGASSMKKMSVFGGLIFACIGRCGAFFGSRSGMESQPFLENFPGVPFSGAFCNGEISFVDQSIHEDSEDGDRGRCSLHHFSTVYLVLSYIPANY